MSRGLFKLDTDSLRDKLQSLEARATKLNADCHLLMERVGMLEQRGLQNTEMVEKEKRLVGLLELLMRDDVRANVINDYAIAFFRLVLLKMRQQGHDFDDLQQLSKALDEDDVGFVFRRILRDLEFPECELSSVITLLEAIKHRKWPSPDTSQVQTSSPAGDAQISSALIYLRAQNELDPQVNASLRRAICLAHESVLSDTAVCEVTPDTNHNDNATGVMALACGRACMISGDDLESILRGRRLLEAIENQKMQCCCFNMDTMLQPRGELFGVTNTRDFLYGCRGFQGKPNGEACLEKEDEEEDGEEEMAARHQNVRPVRLTAGRARGRAVDSWDAATSVGDVIGQVLEGGARRLSVNLAEVEARADSKANDDKAAEGSATIPETYRTSEDGRDRSEIETSLERTDFQDGGMSQIKEKEKEKEEEKDEEEEKEVGEEEAAEQEDASEELALSEEEEGDQNTACANVNTCPAAHYSRLLEHQYLNAAAEFSTWQFVFDLFDDEEGNDNRYRQVEDPHQNPPSLSTAPTSSASRDREDTCDCYLS